ncbi:MAG: glycosyltransferase family 2 protein [Actinomycetales bacterium]|nr:glycosyltransferase family 2 protein [Actinomycetales bacterium]
MRASPHDVGHAAPTVVAVVVTRGATDFLATTLHALDQQTRTPERILVVDADPDDGAVERAVLETWPTGSRPEVVSARGARNLGQAVRIALAEADEPEGAWLWLLHDDSAPAPEALDRLLASVELAPSVAVAGCKQVDWDDPELLRQVGLATSRFGRRMTGLDDVEVDQGQHDGREDVLAVGLAGALVSRDVWSALGGPDPVLGPYGDGLDLCRRARLAGHRVIVVPGAVVRHARASLRGAAVRPGWDARRSAQARREAFLHSQLTGVPLALVPVVALLALGAAVVRAGMRLVLKEPHLVLSELLAPWVVLLRPGRIVAARRRAARTSVLPRRALRPLEYSVRDVLRQVRDRRLAAAEARRSRSAPSELELRELAALRSRRRVGLTAVVLAGLVLTGAVLGPYLSKVLTGSRLTGGTLPFGDADLGGLWAAAGSWWVASGLGHAAPPDPFLAVLVPLTALVGSVGSAGAVLVLGSLLASALGAWFAAGAATRSVALRLWAALAWTATPVLLAGLDQVRLGALLTHVALPWAFLGLARALGVARIDVVQSGLVGAQRVARPEAAPGAGAAVPAAEADRSGSATADVDRSDGATADADRPGGATADADRSGGATADADRSGGATADAGQGTDDPTDRAADARGADPAGDGLPGAGDDAPEPPRTAEPSLAAAAGAGLALCLATAGTPALLPAVLAGLVVVALVRPRRRLWWAALPPLVLHGPTVAAVVADPSRWRALLVAPGLAVPATAAAAWQQLLGWPGEPTALPGVLWGSLPIWAAWVPGGVLLLLAALALVTRAPAGRAVRLGWVLAALGLATAVGLGHLLLVPADGVLTAAWTGGAVSLVVAGLLTAILVAGGRVRAGLSRTAFGWRHVGAALLAVLAFAAPTGLLAGWLLESRSEPPALTASAIPAVPAAGTQLQTSPDAARVLSLEVGDEVRAVLLSGDGVQLTEAQRVPTSDQVTGDPADPRLVEPDDAELALARAAADLTVQADRAADELADLGVGAVLVPPLADGQDEQAHADAVAARTALVGGLDATPGLERVTETDAGVIWRVSTETRTVAWARLVRGTANSFGEVVGPVAAEGRSVSTTLEPGPADRLLVLAERSDPSWRAWLDGVPLRAVETGWRQAFEVGPGGGHLVVRYQPAERRPWQLVQLLVLGATALLAVPVRRRRTR